MHSYNKCKDLEHLFIICGAVHASCISRNPFKVLSMQVNHKTFQESKTLFFFNLQKKTVAFRCVWYLVVPQTGYIYTHYLFSSPGFYDTMVVNVLPEINKNGYIQMYPSENIIFITSADPFLHTQCIIFNQSMFTSL